MPEGTQEKPMIGAMFKGPGPCYMLPGLTGYTSHDTTRKKAPGYVFGIKPKYMDENASPGPAAYKVDPQFTRNGKAGPPEYTLHYRPKEISKFQTPGPDTYRTETLKGLNEKNAPSYSMGGRTRYRKRDTTPGPNSYTLPSVLGSKVPTKKSTPAFTLRGRSKFGGFSEDLQQSPGPGAYNHGDPNSWKKKAPVYSIAGRNIIPGDSTQKPGPATYAPGPSKKSAPKFSFGVRHSEYVTPLISEVTP